MTASSGMFLRETKDQIIKDKGHKKEVEGANVHEVPTACCESLLSKRNSE